MPFLVELKCDRRIGTKGRLCWSEDPDAPTISSLAGDDPRVMKAHIGEVIIKAQNAKWKRIMYRWVCPNCY